MEDEDWSEGPWFAENYTSLRDLKERWMKKQEEEKDRLENERPLQQEKENLKQLRPKQQNQQLFHLHSSHQEEEEGRRRTPYNHSNQVDSRPKPYTNILNWLDDGNAWRRSNPQVIGGTYGVDRRSKLEVLAYENVATEERKCDESELIIEEKKDYESRRERSAGKVKEPDEVVGESLPVAVSSTAMTDGAMNLRAEIKGAGVAREPRAESKGTVSGRREENAGQRHVRVDEKKDVVEGGVEAVRSPSEKRKGKGKAEEEERVREMHMPAEKGDAVDEEVEKNKVQVARNANKKKKKRKPKARGEESVGKKGFSTEEDAKKDDSVIRKSGNKLNVRSEKKKKWENGRNTVVEEEVQKKKDVSVVRNFRIERNGVKRENRGKSESIKEEVGDEKEKVRDLSMQYTKDLRGSNGMAGKPAKDNERNTRAESKSLKDEDGVVEENMRNGVKIDPGKENENEIRAESEVGKNDDVAVEEILRNGMKIEGGKENEKKIRAENEISKDEVEIVEEKLRHSTMPYGNGPRGGNGMETELGKESESLKTVVKEVREKFWGFALKRDGLRGRYGMKYSGGVHWDYRENNRSGGMRREKMVWVKKEESGDGKTGGTRTSSLD